MTYDILSISGRQQNDNIDLVNGVTGTGSEFVVDAECRPCQHIYIGCMFSVLSLVNSESAVGSMVVPWQAGKLRMSQVERLAESCGV